MSEQDDLTRVEAFVTTFIDRLKEEAAPAAGEQRSGFFPKGVGFISLKITNGRANVEVIIAESATSQPKLLGTPHPDRAVQPMFVMLAPRVADTGIQSINLAVEALFTDGQTKIQSFNDVSIGTSTHIDISSEQIVIH